MDAAEGITFGPPLIVDGQKMITDGDGGWGIGPRTAIGQKKDGTVIFLVSTDANRAIPRAPLCVTCRMFFTKKVAILRRTLMAGPVRPCIITAKLLINRPIYWANG